MVRAALLIAVGLACFPAWASNPGEPLDCSDWVFVEPGLSCSVQIPDCDALHAAPWCESGFELQVDNESRILRIRSASATIPTSCGGANIEAGDKIEVVALYPDGTESVIAFVERRCGNPGTADDMSWLAGPILTFDEQLGRVLIPVTSKCVDSVNCTYSDVKWQLRIDGFPTLFEILQTYEPTANEIGFATPYMPEGFQHADFFDTYSGDLATVGDWSQAQPLQCGHPATPPSVGDYLTVPDALPDPAPGQGRYYITAVNYQGQRRFGRKQVGGALSGRDPAELLACE